MWAIDIIPFPYNVATVEYAADIDLPDGVFSHPAVVAVLDNMIDIATIQNVSPLVWSLVSETLIVLIPPIAGYLLLQCKPWNSKRYFRSNLSLKPLIRTVSQKEQSVGDGQNLIIIIMAERQLELQTAVSLATSMLKDRVADYSKLRAAIPSFGEANDIQLNRYLDANASTIQGIARWYYVSPSE